MDFEVHPIGTQATMIAMKRRNQALAHALMLADELLRDNPATCKHAQVAHIEKMLAEACHE